ncbi:uncharacterized protein C19orf47 homolog isoform X2 [Takifugu flavidus]|uniref:uncharacterized protein C19orf47 homolog isoform X2 n=1 Tax=Takifugu flavidus TaxID=433684 RepID=UPI0025440B41|nr:uncharacterized protein C19orf47 homolog isoform X2 [Takifugu flavidus]
MASDATATSEWIQFFKDAGIPAGLAVNYAVSFVDNRIHKNMLMDLSKDIMMDLGITVIGDIIAILRHAKQVYRQDMCKMATEAISSGQTSVKAELRRTANTPATRMIANALSHDSPPSTPARRSDNRLSITVSNTQGKPSGKTVVSQPADEGTGMATVKRRRVTAEMEGLKRTSVFERLGAESKADAANSAEPTGVFSRLDRELKGEIKQTSGKISGTVDVDDDSDEDGSVLQYAGVLKRPPPSQKKESARKPAPTTLRRLGGKFKLPPPDTPTSSSSNGVVPAKRSVLQRLGKIPASKPVKGASPTPADTQDNRVTTSTKPRAQQRLAIASPKVSSSTGAGGAGEPAGARMDVKAVSVFNRLGSKKP